MRSCRGSRGRLRQRRAGKHARGETPQDKRLPHRAESREATFTQTTEDFFRCLESAFAHSGGVPKTLVINNLKAAAAHPDWFDPELTPKVQAFCRHYGTVILPTKPRTPRHKGKIEAGVNYVKNNALKAPQFRDLAEQNRCLAENEHRRAGRFLQVI